MLDERARERQIEAFNVVRKVLEQKEKRRVLFKENLASENSNLMRRKEAKIQTVAIMFGFNGGPEPLIFSFVWF